MIPRTLHEVLTDLRGRTVSDAEWEARDKAEAAEVLARKAAALEKAKRAELERIDAPARAVEALFAGLQTTRALEAVEAVDGIVVLSGGVGCGKTVAAVSWLARFLDDPAVWSGFETALPRLGTRAPVWLSAAKFSRLPKYDESVMSGLFRAPRLVVDDLGVEYLDKGGAYLSTLDELMNERHQRRLPTVATTNLDADAFKARYEERIVDRVRECGRFVTISSQSMRKRVEATSPPLGHKR